jgi:hypothetical protein
MSTRFQIAALVFIDRSACCGFFGQSLRSLSVDRRKAMIEPDHPRLSIVRQCELVSISRSSFYREPTVESEATLRLMRLIDEQFPSDTPRSGEPTTWGSGQR